MLRHPRAHLVFTALSAAALLFSCSSSSNDTSAVAQGRDDNPPRAGTGDDKDGTVTTPEASDSGSDAGSPAPLSCPTAGAMSVAGTISSSSVSEISGIASSTLNDGVYWVHNDSGDTARAFALDSNGVLRATLSFDIIKPEDIEDIAIEDTSGGSDLYFADIGDNDEERTSLTIHRVAEPKLGSVPTLFAASQKMTVVYPDGPHNAETLLFDPMTKDLLIATKKAGGPSKVHRVGPFVPGQKVTTTEIASVAVDFATGGDISRDGHYIAIRNRTTTAFVWLRATGEGIADALARPPCEVPVAAEAQGEAFAFLPANKGYVTASEGDKPELHLTPLK